MLWFHGPVRGDRQMSGPLRTWPTSANQDRCSQSSHSRHDHCLLTDSRCSATGSVIVFWLFCRFHLTLLAVMIASSSAPESRRLLLLLLVSCSCRPSELGGNEVWLRDQSDKTGALVLTPYKLSVQHTMVNLSVFLAPRSSVSRGFSWLVTVHETDISVMSLWKHF